MNRIIVLITILTITIRLLAQSYSPAAGQIGSTAIAKDSSIIIGWATGIEVTRGPMNIEIPTNGLASFGDISNALGLAEGNSTNVVSLGDGGSAILTFASPIMNGNGPDFTVFENGFVDNYMELAFVEVSSDGVNFVRFPSISETQTATQIGPFDYNDCRFVHNLAGNFKQGYGSPFDLDDLVDSSGIDLSAITHIKIIDVIGSINPSYGSYDSQGTLINDLFPTNFESSGFDLDAVGVINMQPLIVKDLDLDYNLSIYPNPTLDVLHIHASELLTIELIDCYGKILANFAPQYSHSIQTKKYNSPFIFMKITNQKNQTTIKKITLI